MILVINGSPKPHGNLNACWKKLRRIPAPIMKLFIWPSCKSTLAWAALNVRIPIAASSRTIWVPSMTRF